ncbi:DegV family protein [Spiroplasma monobiae]|uniref:DegV family protein n=1 Tax=Spiroplasma monobiae MQ-1 TaxID=1336748 RepID=A0A2K9LUW7_SPISQ|nr:DegV family protein [Spiroplasma monobiae]AUM62711.1 DegV family protein [Spiroplasma monobiae MQ-1]
MKIAVLTDSSYKLESNISNVFIVPLSINISAEKSIKDDKSLSDEEFLKIINKNIKTSQTAFGQLEETIENILKAYDQVIICGIAKVLSGQYNSYLLMQREEKFKNKIFVIDSDGVSIILEKQIKDIITLIDQGKTCLEIKKFIEEDKKNYECFIIPKKWTTMVASGRISKFKGFIASTLKVAVVLKVADEKIVLDSKQRSFFIGIKYILTELKSKVPNLKTIDVACGLFDQNTIDKVKSLISESGLKINLWSNLTRTIMINTGEETFAFCAWK